MNELDLFTAALARTDPAERAAFLDRACAGNPDLRRRLDELLAGHARGGSPLDRPPVEPAGFEATTTLPAARATGDWAPDAPTRAFGDNPTGRGRTTAIEIGTVIAGRYTLVGVIGQGGMGSVYLASQSEPVKRQVALKLIKAGMDSKAVLARFDAERQALALMDHPNIARVYDGGTTAAGQPFFVMELVKGVPLTEYCDRQRLSIQARLELFVAVCQAVQHAHQKGIIHRDLKPGNVLVTEVDGRPTPKVIDFGVAKATEQKLTEMSFSDVGAIVGTPAYMSPEQADPTSMDIDTRTDVYALGVMLYELLVGSTPIDARQFKRGAILEMLRMLREVEPPRPSTRLGTADALLNIAANRSTEPGKLTKLLQGELDWVVMKALEKDRSRRYETANGLARDIQRYLADEVVEARPPSTSYRLKKFVRRHKGQVIAASLVLFALLAGMAGTTFGLIEAKKQEGLARTEADEKEVERAKAVAAGNDLKKANSALTLSQANVLKSNDRLLSGVARSLLRPLAVQVKPNRPLPPLNEQEIEPLWELASSTEERLRLRFVKVALQDPLLGRRLKDRSAFALQAAVGLDETRRTQVEALLGRRLQAAEIPAEQQGHVAFCLAALGVLDRSLAGRTVATLTHAMTRTTDPFALRSLAEGLSAVAARLEPKDAARLCGRAATTLTQAMTRTNRPGPLHGLAKGLAAVAARLEPKEAAEAATTLTQAMTRTTDPNAFRYLAEGLAAVAARLEPKEAAEAAATLTQAMTRTTDPTALPYLAQSLSAVLSREGSTPRQQRLRSLAASVAVLGDPATRFVALALAQPSLEPVPPLPPQTLVDLLKHPFCVGEARRLVLEQFSRHYHRPFADQWEFVQFATDNKPPLDLTTPPVRPQQP